jgi:hypothetical protein
MSENQVNTYAEQLAKFAQDAMEKESKVGGGLSWITTAGGVMKFQDVPLPGNKMTAVVLCDAFERHYYTERFNPSKPTSPACFSLSLTGEDMGPHSNVTAPCSQKCNGCVHDAWGSAEIGDGKACKEVRRLGLLAASDLEGDILSAQPAFLKLPVTSVKAYSSYVKLLGTVAKLPVFAVLTEISIERDPKTQFKFVFKNMGLVPEEKFAALFQKREAVMADIMTPYSAAPAPSDDVPAPTKSDKKSKY